MRIDTEEIQLSRYNGLHGREQFYLRHKDSYEADPNNLDEGQEIRKVTLIIFLNEEGVDEQRESDPLHMGALRLYLPTEYIDVVPRMGRAILFKSQILEHEVRPTLGYDNLALTVWFNQVVRKKKPIPVPKPIPEDYTIFVGIAAYKDNQL